MHWLMGLYLCVLCGCVCTYVTRRRIDFLFQVDSIFKQSFANNINECLKYECVSLCRVVHCAFFPNLSLQKVIQIEFDKVPFHQLATASDILHKNIVILSEFYLWFTYWNLKINTPMNIALDWFCPIQKARALVLLKKGLQHIAGNFKNRIKSRNSSGTALNVQNKSLNFESWIDWKDWIWNLRFQRRNPNLFFRQTILFVKRKSE